jgi:hypothetical protein
MRTIVAGVLIMSAAVSARQAVEIDRTLQRVHGTAIMSSDVRQARLLRLLTPQPPSDEGILTALENRLLMLNETSRAAIADPAPAQIAARRQEWQARLPPGTDLRALLERAGMTDRGLDGWFRDDLRIEGHLEQRFPPQDARRDERIAEWIRGLRVRANLKL